MRTYDVFISYAIEDKLQVAEGIAHGLSSGGWNVYFVSDELTPGKSVEEVVHFGLEKSEFYVLVLSPDYVRKWPIIERNYILHREKKERRILAFPAWHRVDISDVRRDFPELLDRYAITTGKSISTIVHSLSVEIKRAYRENRRRQFLKFLAVFALLTVAAFAIIPLVNFPVASQLPSIEEQDELVNSRIDLYEQTLNNELLQRQVQTDGIQITLDSVREIYNQYERMSSQSRNDFIFFNGHGNISGRSNIENLGMSLALSPLGAYGLDSSLIWRLDLEQTDSTFHQVLAFCDTSKVEFEIDTVFMSNADSAVHMFVIYHRNVRIVYYTIHYSIGDRKLRQHVSLMGFKPREEFVLDYLDGGWKIREIK
jgi:hypothetical protein